MITNIPLGKRWTYEKDDCVYVIKQDRRDIFDVIKFKDNNEPDAEYRVEWYRNELVCDCPGAKHLKYVEYCKHVLMVLEVLP